MILSCSFVTKDKKKVIITNIVYPGNKDSDMPLSKIPITLNIEIYKKIKNSAFIHT